MYDYQAELIRIVDGDTLHLQIDLGLDIHVNTVVRLYGVNAPEMKTPEGPPAKRFVEEWFAQYGTAVQIRTYKDKKEKYGRYLATVYSGAETLNRDLLDSNHAVEYLP